MRRPIGPIVFLLALLTGAWVGQAYTLLAPIESIGTADVQAEATVWRFYDAIELLLRTGDDTALLGAVAPDFVDHTSRPGLPPTRDGLVRYLVSLRQTFPALRRSPLDFVAQDDRVVAHLELSGNDEGSVLGIPLLGTQPWASVDIVRHDGSRITEHWGDPAGQSLVTSLLSASLNVPDGSRLFPTLKRVTYAPGANDRALVRRVPAIIVAKTGSIDIHIDASDAATVPPPYPAPLTASPISRSPEVGTSTGLASGNSLVVPADMTFTINNPTDVPAVVIVLLLEALTAPPTTPMLSLPPLPPEIVIRTLAGGTTVLSQSGPHTIAFGWVTLGSGALRATHRTPGTELLFVDAGALTATVTGGSFRAWLHLPNERATAANAEDQITANSGLTVSPGATASYRNDASTPLSLFLATIEPADAASVTTT